MATEAESQRSYHINLCSSFTHWNFYRLSRGFNMIKVNSISTRKLPVLATIMALTIAIVLSPTNSKPATADVVDNWYVLDWAKQPKMYQVDKATGAMTLIGEATQDTGINWNTGAAGFDVDSTNSLGYFIPYSNNPTSLWKVDLVSGQFTNMGSSDAINVTALDIGNNGDVWVAADSLNGQGRGFGRVDIATGNSTFLAAGPERISALATSANGVLYAFSYDRNVYTVNTTTYTFTLVGTTPSMMRAADIDSSGDIILTDWDGYVAKYDLDTNTTSNLFQARDVNNQAINTEAIGVGGPTNGQTLTQAVEAAAAAEVAAAAPIVANGYRADKLGTVYFAPLSSKLSKAAKKKLEAAVIANPSAVYKITGYVQKSKSAKNAKNDSSLSLARAKAIETHLESLGAGVTFTVVTDVGLVPAKKGSSDKARRATLYAMTPVVQ